MTAKEFLKQYEYAAARATQRRRVYELEVERIDAIGSTLSNDPGMPHGTGISRKTEDKAIKLADAAQEWRKAEAEAVAALERVYQLIDSIPGVEGKVLYERYINLRTWENVAEELHYSLPGVFNVHQRALLIVEEKLNG